MCIQSNTFWKSRTTDFQKCYSPENVVSSLCFKMPRKIKLSKALQLPLIQASRNEDHSPSSTTV